MINQQSDEVNYQFEQLYMRYEQMVYNIAIKILNNHHLSEEAVQITFLRFYEKMVNGYTFNEVSIGTSLFLIARGEAITLLKREKKRFFPRLKEFIFRGDRKLAQTIHDQQIVDKIALKINKLPLEDQQIFNLRFYGELKTREISKVLGVNENTIKTKIARIIVIIQELLKDII